MNYNVKIEKKSPPTAPEKRRAEIEDFWKWATLHFNHYGETKNWYEKFVLASSALEQRMLPALMKFIAEHHGLHLPDDLFDRGNNASSTNWLYYGLSHDKKLFDLLESARKKRNNVVHRLYAKGGVSGDEEVLKDAAKTCIRAAAVIIHRFDPKHDGIPSLTLYSRGWNDCRKKILDNMNKKIKEMGIDLSQGNSY